MKWWKTLLVIVGAVIVTALGIDAADTLTGSEGTLLSQVVGTQSERCPKGMSEVDTMMNVTCVDSYEVSAGSKCPHASPGSIIASSENLESMECIAESKSDVTPWGFITRDQAMQMCARTGKRLPTAEEWYQLSLGMSNVEASCNISSKEVSKTGSHSSCITPHGAYDFVGNVWEWVSDDIIDGKYKERALPAEGYVAQVDVGGVAVVSTDIPQSLFGEDYFWAKESGAFGMIRGGYFDSGRDAGTYTIHADTLPTSASIGIGFRCVK